MRLAMIGVGCLLVAGCATARKEPSDRVSAAALGRPQCPEEVLASVAELDPSADWRDVHEEGVRFCVPATWTIRVDELRRNTGGRNMWMASQERGGVSVIRSGTLEKDFPRSYRGEGLFQADVGGHAAEFWYRKRPRPPHDPNRLRETTYEPGYDTFGIWRERGIYMAGFGRTLKDVAVQKLVFQTTRFDALSLGGR